MMRQILLTFCVLFIWGINILYAQCPQPSGSGAYVFDTQTKIDELLINYPDCTELMSYVNIYNNPDTTDPILNLNGFININKVFVLQIYETNLSDLAGLNNLTEIVQTLFIWNNPDLFFLEGLNNLTAIGTGDGHNKFQVYDNPNLFDFLPLENVTNGNIKEAKVANNESLFGLEGIGNMNFDLAMYEFNITNNPNLTVCSVESICEFISGGGNAVISGNYTIGPCSDLYTVTVNCQGTFPQCPTGDLTLSTQADVDQFLIDYPDCAVIPGVLTIDDNDTDPITNLEGLQNIQTVYGLIIKNTTLSDFNGLDELESILGDVEINNTSLNDITFLDGFDMIEGSIRVLNNSLITSLNGLNDIEEISGSIEVVNNDSLITLVGLENILITSITNIVIENNDNLSICNMDSICTYLLNNGTASISDNDTGCNSVSEVEDSCNTPQCPPGDVEFTSQAELDYFLLQYPDCTQISGSMHIGGIESNYNIQNLQPLHNITHIDGTLMIDYTDVANFEGLNNLIEIGNHLGVGYNNSLVNYEGLNNLTIIGNYFDVYQNSLLQDFQGLESLTTVMGGISIQNNVELLNFEGMNNLSEVGISPAGPGIFPEDIFISQNPSLENLNGWGSINVLHASLVLLENENLNNIGALSNLTHIGHPDEIIEVRIQDLPSLHSLQGLENITTIYGDLKLMLLPSLSDIVPLGNLSTIRNFAIGLNNSLTNLDGLQGITEIGWQPAFGELEIYSNNALSSLDGLNNIQKINGTLRIEGNPNIINIQALSNLEIIGNSFTITGNSSLTNLEGLNNLSQTGAYTSGTSNFLIWNNESLVSIEELQNLTSVNNSFISVSGNPQLPSLSGLDNIDPNGIFALELVSSSNLSVCAVESICNFIAITSPEWVHIEGNATGCNTTQEVIDICGDLGTEDLIYKEDITLYPIPVKEWLHIEKAASIKVKSVAIYSVAGELVMSSKLSLDKINVESLATGTYTVVITTEKSVVTKKIIKK